MVRDGQVGDPQPVGALDQLFGLEVPTSVPGVEDALLDPLRFGPLDEARNRYLFGGVVKGTYDILLLLKFQKVRPPEEEVAAPAPAP